MKISLNVCYNQIGQPVKKIVFKLSHIDVICISEGVRVPKQYTQALINWYKQMNYLLLEIDYFFFVLFSILHMYGVAEKIFFKSFFLCTCVS